VSQTARAAAEACVRRAAEEKPMCLSCEILIEGVWKHLAPRQVYRTPDEAKGTRFSIASIGATDIGISPQKIRITKEAFSAAIHFLKTNRHDRTNSIRINSSNHPRLAGPLCTISRERNHGVRCINYILPILHKHQIVGIDSTQPNKTWVIRCDEADA